MLKAQALDEQLDRCLSKTQAASLREHGVVEHPHDS